MGLVGACGRVAFEARSDANGNDASMLADRDGDTFADDIDNCPDLANDQANEDDD